MDAWQIIYRKQERAELPLRSISVGFVMLLRLWKHFSCTKDLHQ